MKKKTKKIYIDPATQAYLKSWGKEETPQGLLTQRVPTLGEYLAFATLGWVKQRPKTWPLVQTQLLLIDDAGTEKGKMIFAMPFSPRTERYVCAMLEMFGWDGRVWPHKDHGWPEGTEYEQSLLWLLKAAPLRATLTFPAEESEEGPSAKTYPVYVNIMKGAFFTAPLIEEPMPRYLQTLRDLALDPTPFKNDWNQNDRNRRF